MVGAMATVNSLLGDSLQCAVQPLSTTSLVVLKMTDSLWTAISGRRVTDEIALCQRAALRQTSGIASKEVGPMDDYRRGAEN